MTAADDSLCRHCLLPVGRRTMRRRLDGEDCAFCCYGCCIAHQVSSGSREEWDAAWLLVRLGVGAFLSMNVMMFSLLIYTDPFTGVDADILPWIHLLLWLFATPAVIILGWPFLRETWIRAMQGRLTASALIVISVGAAYAYSVFATIDRSPQVYFDTACMLLMLFTVGYYLDAAARARASRDLQPLLAAESEIATVVDGDAEQCQAVRDVTAGMLVRVRPGGRIPVDGVIVEGESHVDEAVMSGESRWIAKDVGQPVLAGSINLDGPLLIRSSGAGSATRWAQICRSVRDALFHRSPSQRMADRIVGVFVPVVLALGIATMIYWMQYLPFDRALLTGLAVLVVACPCAVGLAAPLATSLGIGLMARHGCLVREPAALETLAGTRLLAFDKTGTLTSGRAHVVDIETEDAGIDEVLARAAGLERQSEHILAQAINRAAEARGIEPIVVHNVRAIAGRGILGIANGEAVAAGNSALMIELGWSQPQAFRQPVRALETGGYSVIYVGWGGRVRALLSLDDSLLPEARAVITAIRNRGVDVMLLTGDLVDAAQRTGAAIGIDRVQAALSPQAKQTALDRSRQHHKLVAMVGDGLNDGPVLAQADVGIAVGSATDLARETAALVLPPGALWMLPWVIDVARAVRMTILTNLMWAFGYNFVALALAMSGLLRPVLAAAVMAGSSILVVVNSLRLERRLTDPTPVPLSEQPGDNKAADASPRIAAMAGVAVKPP